MPEPRVSDCCFLSFPDSGCRLSWEVTQWCPYNCEYCFTWSSPQRRRTESDIVTVGQRIQQFCDLIEVRDVLITGGEPLGVIDELTPFLAFLMRRGITFSCSSTLHDPDAFARLCRYGPRAINLSVDPPASARCRSAFKSSIARLEEKLALVEAHEVDCKLTAVVTDSNVQGIPSLLDQLTPLLREHPRLKKVAFNREYPIGFAASSAPLTKEALRPAFKAVKVWAAEQPVPVTLVNWDVFHAPLQACPAGNGLLSIMPNGDVAPCSLLYNLTRGFTLGNLLNERLKAIVGRAAVFEGQLRQYTSKCEGNTKRCGTCVDRSACGGGCPAMLPIASDHIARRVCARTTRRVHDHERALLAEFHEKLHIGFSPDVRSFAAPPEPLSEAVESRIREWIKRHLDPSDLAHTFEHIDRVVELTKYICGREGASQRIAVPAAYFHDAAPREPAMHHMHTFKSAMLAADVLARVNGFTSQEMEHIQYCIMTSSYGSYLLGYEPLSHEAEAVRDADWLDAMGARGIARVFAFNQAHGAQEFGYPEHDPEEYFIDMAMNITGPDASPIQHFFTKLLRLKTLIRAETGKELAAKRHQLMVDFIRAYREEMDLGSEDPGRTQQLRLPM